MDVNIYLSVVAYWHEASGPRAVRRGEITNNLRMLSYLRDDYMPWFAGNYLTFDINKYRYIYNIYDNILKCDVYYMKDSEAN